MMSDVSGIMAVLTTNISIAFLLDLDDSLFSALYAESEEALEHCRKDIGVGTVVVCHAFKRKMAVAIFGMQMLGVLHFKFYESLLDLWGLPAMGLLLLLVSLLEFPTSAPVVLYSLASFAAVYALWFLANHCYLVPTDLHLLWPEACEPYVDPWYFHPNATKSKDTLLSHL